MRKSVLFVLGTRPEAIKLAPVIRAFKASPQVQTRVCITGQHRQLIEPSLAFFRIRPDFDLDLMTHDQPLPELTAKVLRGCSDIIRKSRPDLILVQGDTTTAFGAALAAYLLRIPVAHVEAGLRSHRKHSPFPEELNRVLTADLADLHFAPTLRARTNLRREGITRDVHVVGNTVVDALQLGLRLLHERGDDVFEVAFPKVDFTKPLLLVTAHRRESFGAPLANICRALAQIARSHPEVQIVYPVHLNPNVRTQVFSTLTRFGNIHLLEPLDYPHFLWLMSKASLIITDSGGIQEEAPSLGIPLLVVRQVTERTEGLATGGSKVVGYDTKTIVREASKHLQRVRDGRLPRRSHNPYGDGKASGRILRVTARFLRRKHP